MAEGAEHVRQSAAGRFGAFASDAGVQSRGSSSRGQPSGSRPEQSHDSWMRQSQSGSAETSRADRVGVAELVYGSSAAVSGGVLPPAPPPAMSPPPGTPPSVSGARRSLGSVVDEKVKAGAAVSSVAVRDTGKRSLATPAMVETSSGTAGRSSSRLLPTGLEMNGNKRRMYEVESVEQFLKFLGSRDQLGKDEIVDCTAGLRHGGAVRRAPADYGHWCYGS